MFRIAKLKCIVKHNVLPSFSHLQILLFCSNAIYRQNLTIVNAQNVPAILYILQSVIFCQYDTFCLWLYKSCPYSRTQSHDERLMSRALELTIFLKKYVVTREERTLETTNNSSKVKQVTKGLYVYTSKIHVRNY